MEKLKIGSVYDKLIVKDGWVICPLCGRGKILKIQDNTTAHALPVFCRRCGQESIVNIDQRLS